MHLSGLIAALSPETSQFCLEIARAAKKYGTRISFDLNHRASFWVGREEELHRIFKEIASISDILIGNEEDFQLCLGIEGPEAGGKDLGSKIDGFKGMINRVQRGFPRCICICHHPSPGDSHQPAYVGCHYLRKWELARG